MQNMQSGGARGLELRTADLSPVCGTGPRVQDCVAMHFSSGVHQDCFIECLLTRRRAAWAQTGRWWRSAGSANHGTAPPGRASTAAPPRWSGWRSWSWRNATPANTTRSLSKSPPLDTLAHYHNLIKPLKPNQDRRKNTDFQRALIF